MKRDVNRQKRTIKRAARVLAVLTGACLVMLLGGCGKKEKEPVTVTLWHVYGGQTESPLNDLIDEFNETVGKDKNIRVEVGSVTNTNIIGASGYVCFLSENCDCNAGSGCSC